MALAGALRSWSAPATAAVRAALSNAHDAETLARVEADAAPELTCLHGFARTAWPRWVALGGEAWTWSLRRRADTLRALEVVVQAQVMDYPVTVRVDADLVAA